MTERPKLPAPSWIPINKASLASWRNGPTEVPPALQDDAQRDIVVVRAVNATAATMQAVVRCVDDATFVEMGEPRALAKGSTPMAGPAAAPPIESMSPGVSPGANNTQDPPAPPPLDGGMDALALPPALEDSMLRTSALVCAVTRNPKTAADVVAKLKASCENAVVDIQTRTFPSTSTVVLKGVPLSIKHDRLWQELAGLQSAKPSYLRFHRNDRGLFKNVVYLKFASPLDAELGRMELERFTVGGRPLKVEFKKPRTATTEEAARAEAARREDLKVAMISSIDNMVSDLQKSAENEGFSLPKAALSKDETRYLRGLCQAHEFMLDIGPINLTVKKRVAKSMSPSMGPARTPPIHPATPSTHAADPADVSGLQFRGIRHWREARAEISSKQLGLHRCLGPADGVPAWGAGRGRPQR